MGLARMESWTKRFYKSKAWQRCRESVLTRDNYLCQRCLRNGKLTPADVVHHIEHLQDNPGRAFDESNLESVCAACHNRLHPEKGRRETNKMKRKRKARIIRSVPNDEAAAL